MNSPTTKKEAQDNWKKYTKSVLSRDAKKSFKTGENWVVSANGVHIVVSGDGEFAIAFVKSKYGHVSGVDLFARHPELPRGAIAAEWFANPQWHN